MSVDIKTYKGTTQKDRYKYIYDDCRFKLFDLSEKELMAFTSEYASLLKYWNSNNVESGTWEVFFKKNAISVLCSISSFDIEHYEKEFMDVYNLKLFNDNRQNAILSNSILNLAYIIDEWNSCILNSNSNDDLRITKIISHEIKNILSEELSYIIAYERYRDDNSYAIEIDKERLNNHWKFRNSITIDDISEINKQDFLEIFQVFDHSIKLLVIEAERDIELLKKSGKIEPSMGLLLGFFDIITHTISPINDITKKVRKFYYNDILKPLKRKRKPEKTYISLTKSTRDEINIDKSTRFILGKDISGKEIEFIPTEKYILNSTNIEALYSVFIKNQDEFNSGECHQKLHINYTDIKKLPKGNSFNIFGSTPESNTDNEFSMCISSPVLYLSEGLRKVKIDIILKKEQSTESSKYFKTLSKNLKHFDKLKKRIEKLKKGDIGKIFKLYITSDDGWIDINEYTISGDFIKNISITFLIGKFEKSTGFYNKNIHKELFETEFPTLKIELAENMSNSEIHELLSHLVINKIELETAVTGLRNLTIRSNRGKIKSLNEISPFGVVPKLNNWFAVGNYEMAIKNIITSDILWEWSNLPEPANLSSYYYSYNPQLKNSNFKCTIEVLSNSDWARLKDPKNSVVNLFDEIKTNNNNKASKNVRIDTKREITNINLRKNWKATPYIDYKSFGKKDNVINGFLKLELISPQMAFGYNLYPSVLNNCIAKKSKNPNISLPNPPLSPLISDVCLNYRASQTLEMDSDKKDKSTKVFICHKLGYKNIYLDEDNTNGFIPKLWEKGNLLIGLTPDNKGKVINFLFDMVNKKSKGKHLIPPEIKWFYLKNNQWKLIPSTNFEENTTNNLLNKGIISITIPEDITSDNSILGKGLFWLKASVKHKADSFPDCKGIHPHAICIERNLNYNDSDQIIESKIQSTSRQEDFTKIEQLSPYFGGNRAETEVEREVRISERINNRKRAITCEDFEKLVLSEFPDIYSVKCFSHTTFNYYKPVKPGNILITVIPNNNNSEYSTEELPIVDNTTLKSIQNYLNNICSPFTNIEVCNPDFDILNVSMKLRFKTCDSEIELSDRIKTYVRNLVSPWNKTSENYSSVDNRTISSSEIYMKLNKLNYVDEIESIEIYRTEDKTNDNNKTDEATTMSLQSLWSLPIIDKVTVIIVEG